MEEDALQGYREQMEKELAKTRWIDQVDIQKSWPCTLTEDKKKQKGDLVIGNDDCLGFVSKQKVQNTFTTLLTLE